MFSSMASLYVVRGRDQGKHFVLAGSVARLGRDAHNEVQLLDSEASRSHAEIRIESDGECLYSDLSSSNGSQINGQPVTQKKLGSGDRIEIGTTLLIFTGAGLPTAVEAAHGVDIVRQSSGPEASRIISSLVRPTARTGSFRSPAGFRDEAGREVDESDVDGISPLETLMSESHERDPVSPQAPVSPQDVDQNDSESPKRIITDSDRSLEVMYLTALAVGRTDDLDQLLDRILRLT